MLSKSLSINNKKPLFLSLYNPNDYIPKTSLYTLFFKQNQMQFPKKLIQSVFSSYFGGVVFGGMMLGLTLINNVGVGGMDFLSEAKETTYKFQSTQEFFDNCKYQIRSLHQNGKFVIKYTLFMGLVNAASTYFPTLNSNFDDLYGYKNMHFICNCALPTVMLLNFYKASFPRRILYTSIFPITYYLTAKARKMYNKYQSNKEQLTTNANANPNNNVNRLI